MEKEVVHFWIGNAIHETAYEMSRKGTLKSSLRTARRQLTSSHSFPSSDRHGYPFISANQPPKKPIRCQQKKNSSEDEEA